MKDHSETEDKPKIDLKSENNSSGFGDFDQDQPETDKQVVIDDNENSGFG